MDLIYLENSVLENNKLFRDKKNMIKVLITFSQSHLDFRIAEFEAVCEMFGINYISNQPFSMQKHVYLIDFENLGDVQKLLSRAVLIKYAFEFLVEAENYENLYQQIGSVMQIDKSSFALRIFSIGRKKKLDNIERIRNFLENVEIDARVDLKNPEIELYLVEEYEKPDDEAPKRVYFTKLIGEGRCELKTKYNLRERCYIGNTTMDPELSFIQANISQIRPANLVLDPFVGTGGLILPAAEFGAFVIGTEINYQTARAKGRSSRQGVGERGEDESILANFEQYSTADKLLSIVIGDSSKHGIWRKNMKFDVIVTDPPYGVREKARKLGSKEKPKNEDVDYIRYPEKEEYNLENTYCDLLDLAANMCVIGGVLSFWYPVILENYCEDNLPKHPAMQLIFNCEQGLTRKSSRRLLTYRKIREPEIDEEAEIVKTGVSKYRSTLFSSQ